VLLAMGLLVIVEGPIWQAGANGRGLERGEM